MAFSVHHVASRLIARAEPHGECLLYVGSLDHKGYGRIRLTVGAGERRSFQAHRLVFESRLGPIAEGLVLDHLCRIRRCINVDHLEPVTNRENVLRGKSVMAERAAATHCEHGHEFTPANTYVRPSRPTRRECVACRHANSTKWRARRSAA